MGGTSDLLVVDKAVIRGNVTASGSSFPYRGNSPVQEVYKEDIFVNQLLPSNFYK